MNGPVVNTDNGASKWGVETNIQKMIGEAAQYNPQTKLGITNGDQASKIKPSFPTSDEALANEKPKLGFGPDSGLEGNEPVQGRPTSVYQGPHPFASRGIDEHKSHLSRLTNLSPAMQQYLHGGK